MTQFGVKQYAYAFAYADAYAKRYKPSNCTTCTYEVELYEVQNEFINPSAF